MLVSQALRRFAIAHKTAWQLRGQSEAKESSLISMTDELLVRLDKHDEEERSHKILSHRAMNLAPDEWPQPPDRDSHPLQWVRARVLYCFCPADRDLGYAIKHNRQMLLVPILLILPYVSTPLWLLLLALFLISVEDPFQLLNAIWTFKLCTLVMWGVIPILHSHFERYLLLTSTNATTSCPNLARSYIPTPLHAIVDVIGALELDCFYLCWILCYALYFRASRSLEQKRSGTYTGLFTNDQFIDLRALTLIFAYDLGVFVCFTLVQRLYLLFAIIGFRRLGDFVIVISWAPHPPPEYRLQCLEHRYCNASPYSHRNLRGPLASRPHDG